MSLRVASTFSNVSPPLFETMEVLGRERVRRAAGGGEGPPRRLIRVGLSCRTSLAVVGSADDRRILFGSVPNGVMVARLTLDQLV